MSQQCERCRGIVCHITLLSVINPPQQAEGGKVQLFAVEKVSGRRLGPRWVKFPVDHYQQTFRHHIKCQDVLLRKTEVSDHKHNWQWPRECTLHISGLWRKRQVFAARPIAINESQSPLMSLPSLRNLCVSNPTFKLSQF